MGLLLGTQPTPKVDLQAESVLQYLQIALLNIFLLLEIK